VRTSSYEYVELLNLALLLTCSASVEYLFGLGEDSSIAVFRFLNWLDVSGANVFHSAGNGTWILSSTLVHCSTVTL
jgi:hypothetical protein